MLQKLIVDKKELTELIKEYSIKLGFELVGVTSSEKISDFEFYQFWIDDGFAAGMDYLQRNTEKRENPELLLPGTKSVICLGLNYYYPFEQNEYKIARYALGDDYHEFMKVKINSLLDFIKTCAPDSEGRSFVDSAPVLERSLAKRAGLGWIGKNTMLINNKKGSYFLLGELFINIELEYDQPVRNYCGKCTRCIDACPTKAIIEEGKIDAGKCISYLTIESKEEIHENLVNHLENNIFGCDICQEVCPWNRFSVPSQINEIKARNWINNKSLDELLVMSQEDFSKLFKNSPVKRAKLKGFMRNIIAVITSKREKKFLPLLEILASNEEVMIRNQAITAIKQLSGVK